MKTKANQAKPTHPQAANRICRSMALILAALVLQGCATAKTAWSRPDTSLQAPVRISELDAPQKESRPAIALLTFRF